MRCFGYDTMNGNKKSHCSIDIVPRPYLTFCCVQHVVAVVVLKLGETVAGLHDMSVM